MCMNCSWTHSWSMMSYEFCYLGTLHGYRVFRCPTYIGFLSFPYLCIIEKFSMYKIVWCAPVEHLCNGTVYLSQNVSALSVLHRCSNFFFVTVSYFDNHLYPPLIHPNLKTPKYHKNFWGLDLYCFQYLDWWWGGILRTSISFPRIALDI